MKCLHNRLQDSKDSDNDSTGVFLSWSPLISEHDRPFLLTAALMLKFGFPEVNIHLLLSRSKMKDTVIISNAPTFIEYKTHVILIHKIEYLL